MSKSQYIRSTRNQNEKIQKSCQSCKKDFLAENKFIFRCKICKKKRK